MKTTSILIFVITTALAACQPKPEQTKKNYTLVSDDDGILVEQFDSTLVDENKYNHNNTIYKVGNSFTYSFEHITKDGEKRYFNVNEDGETWEFADAKHADSATIQSINISVGNGNPIAKYYPDFNQTTLKYKMGQANSYSMSGAIENEANVWIHPIRENYFKILELNPFPYIKAPYKIGNEWTWQLKIGSQWADERWKTWEGNIENQYEYRITGETTLKTELGTIDCLVVESTATSRLGETGLTAYFNPKYGFVKLDYTNIDGSKTNLEMTEYSEQMAANEKLVMD